MGSSKWPCPVFQMPVKALARTWTWLTSREAWSSLLGNGAQVRGHVCPGYSGTLHHTRCPVSTDCPKILAHGRVVIQRPRTPIQSLGKTFSLKVGWAQRKFMELKSLLKVRYTHFQKVRAKKIRVVSRAQKPPCPDSGAGWGWGTPPGPRSR